jgi:mRNA interferase MazF
MQNQPSSTSGTPLTGKILKTLKAGDIVIVNLDPTVGHEKQKTRACLVVEPGGSPLELIIVLPISEYHGGRSESFFVPIKNYEELGLTKASAVDCYQIQTISVKRLKKKLNGEISILGSASATLLKEVRKRLALILDITEEHM